MYYRGQLTFSVKDQKVNTLGFEGQRSLFQSLHSAVAEQKQP